MDNNVLQLIIRLKDEATQQLNGFANQLDKAGTNLKNVGGKMIAFGAAPTAALALAAKTAIDFESAFAGIRKTVDASEAEFSALSNNIRQIAKETPTSTIELSKIGELAGQLGVRGVSNLTKFIDTVAKISVTTNLTSEEAATSFARIANIMQEPIKNIDKMASVVVDLGNNFATTESEVVAFATRIAGAGRIAGLTTDNIFSIGAAMSSVGVEAEAGGTAVQKVLIAMNTAVTQNNKDLAVFAKTAGLTIDEFKDLSAVERFQNFVMGLGDAGDDAITVLEQLGLQDQRLIRSFLSLANAGDLVINATEKGTEAWQKNTAAAVEAQKRFATTESQLKIMRNNMADIGITLGSVLLPAINNLLTAIKPMIEGFAQFAQQHPQLITGILAIGAGIGVLGVILTGLGIVISGISAVLPVLAALIGFLLSPIGLVVLAIAGLVLAFIVFRDQIMAILQTVYDFFVMIFTAIWTFISTVFNTIWTIISTILTAIWNFISYVLNTIYTIFQFIFLAIWSVIQMVLALIMAYINERFGWLISLTNTSLTAVANKFMEAFNAIKNIVTTIFTQVSNWFTNSLNSLSNNVKNIIDRIVGFFRNMADGIMSALRSIKFPHLNISMGETEVAGMKIQYPKLNVDWYEKGGWVRNTGLAVVHEGEYVMSKDMLAGKTPSEVTNNNQPITINNIINSQVDLDAMGYQLAWALRNSR